MYFIDNSLFLNNNIYITKSEHIFLEILSYKELLIDIRIHIYNCFTYLCRVDLYIILLSLKNMIIITHVYDKK